MKHCFITKQRTLLLALCLTAVCSLVSSVANGQAAVDCSVSANCTNAYCNFASTVEKGCRCFDGLDNDNDGKIDKADSNCATYYGLTFVGEGSNCSIVPPGTTDPFDLVNVPITSAQNTADTQSKVSVGDVDGDGIPDAVITSKWNSEMRVIATRAPQADGTKAGDVKSDFNLSGNAANTYFSGVGTGDCVPQRLLFEHENLIADIDKDGKAELFGVVSNRGGNPETPPICFYLVGFKYAADDLVPLWTKAVSVGKDRPGTFGIADMDGDGKAELYLRDRIYAAETGALLAQAGGNWDSDVTSAPVAVNILGDNKMELVCGTKIYTIPSLSNRTVGQTPAALTLAKDMNDIMATKAFVKVMLDPVEYGEDTHSSCSVADIDRDGVVDVVISGASGSNSGPTTVYYWNVAKNFVTSFSPPDGTYANGWIWGTGRVNLGDANGDGKTDLTFIAGNKLWCMTTDASGNIIPLWASPRTINDSRSGVLTVTIYDFNNDGKPEMVYRDSQILAVVDGTTGTQLQWSAPCQSHTYTEGPIIADVNGDGGTDICVPCYTNSVAGAISSIKVDNAGSNYTSATVTITGAGTGATATATIKSGKISGITVTNAGSGYDPTTPPTVTITGNGTGATATATVASGSFSINDGLQQQALGQFRLYYSAANDWLPTRKVWNQPGYFVVNIKDNLQLPFPQLDQNLIYSNAPCPNGLPGPQMPMNVFLNQVPYLSADGCPVFPAPDLSFTGDNPDTPGVDTNGDGSIVPAVEVIPPICGNEAIQAKFRIINDGDLPMTLNVPVSFWKADPRLATTQLSDRLYTTTINISNLAVDATLVTDFIPFNGTGGTFRLYIVLNNAGNVLPINPTMPSNTECRLDNNIYSVNIVPNPFTTTITKLSDNYKCLNNGPNTGSLEVRIYKAGIEDTDYSKYSFQWYSGLPSGTLTLLPGQTGRTATGLGDGDYTARVTNIVNNCTGQYVSANIVRTGVDPDVIITETHQTLCNPPNGSLTAVVQGPDGNAGYSFEWTEIGGSTLAVTTAIANNLVAGNYKLVVGKAGCFKQFDAPIIKPPVKPDVKASVVKDVEDCNAPKSGEITASAYDNIVLQDPNNYTFTWKYYNSNGTTGSILDPVHGTGPTRTGLPVGSYIVSIVDNVTKCEGNQQPVVTVTSKTILPTADIARTASNTSCDPLKPNGVLTASAAGGTFVSPNDFKFEWFRGPNTDPANKLPKVGSPETVSGVKGEILNSASGGGTIYTVKVTTPLNCSATFERTVLDELNVPVLTLAELSPNSVCDVTKASNPYNGSIQATVTFAGNTVTLPDPNYKFTWYDGTTTTTPHTPAPTNLQNPILSGLIDGNYAATVERTDLFCLSVPKTVPVTKATILPVLSATSTGSNNCSAALTPDGTVTVTVTNTAIAPGPFTYQWYAGNVVGVGALGAANNGTSATAIKVGGPVGAPNPYTVQVVNTATGCVNNTTQFVADVSVIPVLSFGLIKPNTICAPITSFNGQMNAQVDNIPAGYTIADYTFRWYDGQTPTSTLHNPASTTTQLDKLDAGFYTVEATNTKTGCPSAPISNQVPNGKITPLLQPASTGSNNCDASLTPDGTVSYTVTNIQPGDAFTQQWYNGNAVVAGQEIPALNNNGTSVTAIKLGGPTGAPKPYTVLVTNTVTGCTNFTTAAVPDISVVPVVTTSVVANSICAPSSAFNGQFSANVSNIPALYTLADYDFTFSGTRSQGPSADNTLDNAQEGPYSVIAKNRLTGCVSAPANNNVPNLKVFPDLTPSSTGSNNCIVDVARGIVNNGTASVAVAVTPGPHTFQWYAGSGDPIATPLTPLPAGNSPTSATATFLGGPVGDPHPYTVLVTDVPSGCTSFVTAFVADISVNPVLALGPVTANTICAPPTPYDGSVTVQVSNMGSFVLGDFDFTWFDDAAMTVGHADPNPADDNILTQLIHEDYTVRVENTKTGCTSGPLTAQVPDGRVNPMLEVTTTGSHNCTNGPGILLDGTATVAVTNNTFGDGMSVLWTSVGPTAAINATNNNTPFTATGLGGPVNAPNTYNALVTNNRTKCFSNAQGLVADLSVKPVPVLAAFENHVCDPALITQTTAAYDGHVDVTSITHPIGATGPSDIVYQWRDVSAANVVGAIIGGQTASSLVNRPAGKYASVVTITSLGCTSDPVIEEVIDDLDAPVLVQDTDPNTNCPGGAIVANGMAEIETADGNALPSANYTIQWFDGGAAVGAPRAETSPILGTQIVSGTFTAEVTNRTTGCKASEPMTVVDARVIPSIAVSVVSNNINCTGTPSGALLATPTNAGASFSVTWTPAPLPLPALPQKASGVGNVDYTALPAGAYSATVTNTTTGCVSPSDGQNIIDQFTYPVISFTTVAQTSCNTGAPNGSITANDPGGRSFSWYTGLGTGSPLAVDIGDPANLIDNLPSNNYTLEVTIAATGCKTTSSEFVPNNIVQPTVALANTKPVEICGPIPSGMTPDGEVTVTLGGISAAPNFTVFYVRTEVIGGVGAGTYPTNPAVIKLSPETYSGGANPPLLTDLAPGYFTALVVDNNTSCESVPQTVQVVDATADYTFQIVGVANAGLCNPVAPGGSIDLTVNKDGAPCTTCTYEWYSSTPSNSNINFFNNPPTFAGNPAPISTDLDLGVVSPAGGVSAGDYTIVVFDTDNGCGDYHVENIPTANPATVVVTPTQPTECVNASNPQNNGSIQVQVTKDPLNVDGYTVNIYAGNAAAGVPLISDVANTTSPFTVTLNDLDNGDYFIEVIDEFLANKPCPQGFQETLVSQAFNPVVTIDQITPNTSCDPNTSADGKVELTVTKDGLDSSPDQDYFITAINPAPVVAVPGGLPLIVGNGNSGASVTIDGFEPLNVEPIYTIRVVDNISSCFKDVTVSIPDAQDVPSVLNVAINPETNCSNALANNSNGNALVSLTDPLETEDIFDFTWDNDVTLATPVYSAPGDNAQTGGELLNQSKAPGNWTMGALGQGSGNRTYFVQGIKNATAPTGVGCKTAVLQVVIPDQHVSPDMTLTPFFDSFCQATAVNNAIGDGKITVVADANPSLGGQQIPVGGVFSYAWTPVPVLAAPGSPQLSGVGSFDINQLHDGTYTVTVTNPDNACIVQNQTTIAPAPYVLSIVDADIQDQRICNNDGSIEVKQIVLKNASTNTAIADDNTAALIDPSYTFRWYNNAAMTAGTELEDAVAPDDIIHKTLGHDANGDFIADEDDYGLMQAGTYYVVATRSAAGQPGFGCPTLPFQVVVNDVHVNPVPTLTVLSNTSCLPAGPGEGEIHITMADNTPAPFDANTFQYTWVAPGPIPPVPNVNPTPAANGDGLGADDQFINLIDNVTLGNANPYTVQILNTVTGCTTSGIATIVKNATPVFVQSVTVTPEILCAPTGDGSITVTRVTLNDRNGNEEEFVPAPVAGQGNITDFNFEWRRGAIAFTQTTAGNVLNSGNYDTDPLPGGFGNVIGAGTYTVTARRATGAPGAGCPSAPFEVVISDQRINPVVSVTPFDNTSCATAAGDMEGELRVKVTDGSTAVGPAGFAYTWTASPALTPLGAGTGDGDGFGAGENDGLAIDNDNDYIRQRAEGPYSVTVTSNKSGCQGVGNATIIKNTTPIFIQDVAVLNQVLCGPDGSLTVQTVTLNDRNGSTTTFPPNMGDFDFTWTRAGMTGSQTTVGTVLNPITYDPTLFTATPPATNAFGLGQYTVVATRQNNGPGNGCSSAPFSVSILDRRIFPVVTLTPFANTSCSTDPLELEGEIEVDVTDVTPAGVAGGFDYTWDNSTNGTDITSANPANNGNGTNDGDDDNPTTLGAGIYRISVLNNASGCTTTAQTEIFTNSTPVFTQLVTPTDQVLCSNDGKLVVNEVRVIDRDQNVQSSNGDFPISDFQFTYSRGASVASAVTIPAVTGTQLDVNNYGAIGADTYFVVARRTSGGPGLDCTSPPYKVDIQNKQLFPVVSLTPFANTSCDPTFFEGEIEVRVTDASVNIPAPLTGAPFSYAYTWTTTATPAVINGLVAGTHDGDGDGADGDGDHPMTLNNGDYVVSVRNTQTNCISTGSTTIFRNSTPVFTQLVTPVHAVLCNPDGSLTVNEVKVIDRDGNVESNLNGDFPLTHFSFRYDRAVIGSTITPNVTASVLNNVNYPTIGIDDYYVVATRVAGGPGLNCSSAPYKVTIEDRRLFPTVNFTSTANSSCNVNMPNGSVTANAAEANPATIDAYTFAWTLNGGGLSPASSVSNPTPRQSIVADALDGAYIVTATNTRTGCDFDASFNLKLDQTRSTPNIIKVDVMHPTDCKPSATARVLEITLGSTTNSVLFPPNNPPDNVISGVNLSNFTFSWYQGATAPANQLPLGGPFFTTPCIGPDCNPIITTGLTAGKYYVTVLDPRTDCQSEPKELIVNDNQIIYPLVEIMQSKLQVSCISGVGSAELQATADGFTDANANYVFEWFRNLDATPPVAQTGSTFSNLVPGNYSVEVLDIATACRAEQLYIVPDDAELFRPGVSLSSDPRFNCLQPDGTLLARELNFNPNRYPFPAQNFSAELYSGANADVTVPGTVMPVFSAPLRTWLSIGLDVGTYTVKIVDNNTGCIATNQIAVADKRTPPAVIVMQENPLINCDPARPNGQLSATADGGLIGGYGFDWYQGGSATGVSLGTNNVVSGLTLGAYTVRVTNNLTGCFDDETGNITDGRLKAPVPNAEVKAHRTHCIYPDGWVSASVEGITISYNFEWFDGQTDAGSADFIGPDYIERAEGFYTVKAQDRTTGCYSDPISVEVLNKSEIPKLVFTTTPSFCEDLPDNMTKGNGTLLVELKPENLLSDSIAWSKIETPTRPLDQLTEGELIITEPGVGMAAYVTDLYPGFYKGEVTTIKGCRNWGVTEVKTEIRAYNLVTRNSDGKNDAFVVDCISRFPNNNVKIFNRAGVKVYEADGYDNVEKVFRGLGEIGVYTTGNDLPVGTYFYIIDKRDGSKPRTGYLELVK